MAVIIRIRAAMVPDVLDMAFSALVDTSVQRTPAVRDCLPWK
jgi:hypothetical protein